MRQLALAKKKIYRLTSQRMTVLEQVRVAASHPTAEDVFRALKPAHSTISLATVYRNLRLLAKQGKIRECEFSDGTYHYDSRLDLHGHFICEDCRAIIDFEIPEKMCPAHFGAYQAGIVKKGTIDFYGTCKKCIE